MCLRYSSAVVAPITWISPRDRGGLRMEAASMEPSAEPAPMMVWISSMKRMASSRLSTSAMTFFRRSSNSPRYLEPATSAADVERPDLLAAQDVGHVARGDELRQALDDGGLAHARVAQDERVVLLAARQHLHHALDLAVAPDDRVELAVGGQLGEVAAVALEHGVLVGGLTLAGHGAHARPKPTSAGRTLAAHVVGVVLGDELAHGVAHGVARDAHARAAVMARPSPSATMPSSRCSVAM